MKAPRRGGAKYCFSKLRPPRPTFLQDITPDELKLMQEHAAYLHGFARQGSAMAFGPVADPVGAYGVCARELPDGADLHTLCADDPVIKSGRDFRFEIHPMPFATGRK